MKPKRHYLPAADLRLAVRWTAEQASPGKIAVAVPETQPKKRRNGRIVLLDPTDATRHILLETTS